VNTTIFGAKQDIIFMSSALEQAHQAYERGEVPVGAVVIDENGVIIAQAYNQVEHTHTQRTHAEMIALEQAARNRGNWRLAGCWLYVTLEPCMMCVGLAQLSRVAGIVYGASSPLVGFSRDTGIRSLVESDVLVIGGVEAEKAELLLRTFFKEQRIKDRE
jgi:tRNA(adenine34) deaminase